MKVIIYLQMVECEEGRENKDQGERKEDSV
jgi:hypothetical protein